MMTKTTTGKFRNIVNGMVGATDKIIFGTGDNLRIITMTGDAKFVRGVSAQGVDFEAYLHSPVPLGGG